MISIEPASVEAAARRLAGHVVRTPIVHSRSLDERAEASLFVKAEPLQRTGSFKFRGAMNRLLQLPQQAWAASVVAYSSGNHAQAVALAAREVGALRGVRIPACIVMPANAPHAKLAAVRAYGAEVHLYDPASESREAIAARLLTESGGTLVPPFDDPHIIAGQGTAA